MLYRLPEKTYITKSIVFDTRFIVAIVQTDPSTWMVCMTIPIPGDIFLDKENYERVLSIWESEQGLM